MKKYLCFFCVLFSCVFVPLLVKADIIWEPEDSFFRSHVDDMGHLNRKFTAAGPDGEVIFYKNPNSAKVMHRVENGKTLLITWVYTDGRGIAWGFHEDEEGEGWAPMEYMQVVYDSIEFQKDFEDEITEEKGSLDGKYQGKSIYLWDYPGAEDCFSIEITEEEELPQYEKVYKDGQGRNWGNADYYYGYRNVWICIDFPEKNLEQLYPDGAPDYETEPEEKEFGTERITPKPDYRTMFVAIAIVCLVVLATAGSLIKLKKKKQVNGKKQSA